MDKEHELCLLIFVCHGKDCSDCHFIVLELSSSLCLHLIMFLFIHTQPFTFLNFYVIFTRPIKGAFTFVYADGE